MRTLKKISNETKNDLELKGLIEVYEELAALKMQKIRYEILASREFFNGLAGLSEDVGVDLANLEVSTLPETALVLVTANTGLYGDIIDKTFNLFLEFLKNTKADIFVVGRLGEELMRQYAPEVKYQMLALSDDKIEDEGLHELITRILPYKKIALFYGEFRNVAVQNAVQSKLSGEMLPKTKQGLEALEKRRLTFLYEPSLWTVSEVFAKEILGSLIEQMLREGQLAKFGSRLMHLDQAVENVDRTLKVLISEKWRVRKKILDKKQNLAISGIMAREGLA